MGERWHRYHIIPPAVMSSASTVPNIAPSTPKPAPGAVNSTPNHSTCLEGKIRKKLNTISSKHISIFSIRAHAYSRCIATCHPQGNSVARREGTTRISGNRADESLRIASSPPNHPGSIPLMEMPDSRQHELKTNVAAIDWRSIFRASTKSPAPIRCAT